MIRLLYSKQYQNRQAELDYQQLIKTTWTYSIHSLFQGDFQSIKIKKVHATINIAACIALFRKELLK